MGKLLLLMYASVLLFSSTTLAGGNEWRFFKLTQTTEEDVIAVFGTPDTVEIQCSYETLKNSKQSRMTDLLTAYELTYTRFRGDLNILKGPLGEAASTKVQIDAGKVVSVDWDYAVKYKTPAEALWKSDKSFDTRVAGAITIGRKSLTDGTILYVTCSNGSDLKCDGTIHVNLDIDSGQKH